jgi:hypothetical protein
LSSINPPAVADAVKELYCSDEVAEWCQVKDYVTAAASKIKTHEQQTLVLSNLKGVYTHFKSSYPKMEIG